MTDRKLVRNEDEFNSLIADINRENRDATVWVETPQSYPCIVLWEIREHEYSEADVYFDFIYPSEFSE